MEWSWVEGSCRLRFVWLLIELQRLLKVKLGLLALADSLAEGVVRMWVQKLGEARFGTRQCCFLLCCYFLLEALERSNREDASP